MIAHKGDFEDFGRFFQVNPFGSLCRKTELDASKWPLPRASAINEQTRNRVIGWRHVTAFGRRAFRSAFPKSLLPIVKQSWIVVALYLLPQKSWSRPNEDIG